MTGYEYDLAALPALWLVRDKSHARETTYYNNLRSISSKWMGRWGDGESDNKHRVFASEICFEFLSRRLLPLSLRVAYLSLELIFWYSTKPAVEGKFCLDAWTIRRVSSYVCSVTGTRKTL